MKSSKINRPISRDYVCGAVIVCAGKGERTGLPYNKVLYNLGCKTVLETTLDAFSLSAVNSITVVAAENDVTAIKDIIKGYDNVRVCQGGATRLESVYNGLKSCPCDIVVVHDGARPYVSHKLIDDSIAAARQFGSGIAAVPTIDSVKYCDGGEVRSLDRSKIYNAQTPQTFIYKDILSAYERAIASEGCQFTDDAQVYESAGFAPHLIDGELDNIKITTARDLFKVLPRKTNIGVGFDVHRLIAGRKLILGGVNVPYELGLDGHSDADVLTHAVMDALLSAAGLPDIGVLFPDTADEYDGISSVVLLKRVLAMLSERELTIRSISAVIIAQKPKLADIISTIKKSLADALDMKDGADLNISATTAEHLGLIGEGKAIAASASCLLTEKYV